jgi:MraZ protein
MSESVANEKIYYLSRYDHEVDDKRRVQIPAKWRPASAEVELTLILWGKGNQKNSHILVLPPGKMESLAEKVSQISVADDMGTALRRLVGSRSDRAKVDKAGRMCIPEDMAAAVGIKGAAVLVGLVDCFEIWNPERHESVIVEDDVHRAEAFKKIV